MSTRKARSFSVETRKRVLRRFDGCCAYCGAALKPSTLTVDHVHPVYRGGTNDYDNLFPACRGCNNQKSTFTIEEFRTEITAQATRMAKPGRARIAIACGVIAMTGEAAVFYFERSGTRAMWAAKAE